MEELMTIPSFAMEKASDTILWFPWKNNGMVTKTFSDVNVDLRKYGMENQSERQH